MADFEIKVGGDSDEAVRSMEDLGRSVQDLGETGRYAFDVLNGRLRQIPQLLSSLRAGFAALWVVVSANPIASMIAGFLALGAVATRVLRMIRDQTREKFDGIKEEIRELEDQLGSLRKPIGSAEDQKVDQGKIFLEQKNQRGLEYVVGKLEQQLARQVEARNQAQSEFDRQLGGPLTNREDLMRAEQRLLEAEIAEQSTRNALEQVRTFQNKLAQEQADEQAKQAKKDAEARASRIEDAGAREASADEELRRRGMTDQQELGNLRSRRDFIGRTMSGMDRDSPEFAEARAELAELDLQIAELTDTIREARAAAAEAEQTERDRQRQIRQAERDLAAREHAYRDASIRSALQGYMATSGIDRRAIGVGDFFSHVRNVRSGNTPNEDIANSVREAVQWLRRLAEAEGVTE